MKIIKYKDNDNFLIVQETDYQTYESYSLYQNHLGEYREIGEYKWKKYAWAESELIYRQKLLDLSKENET